MGRSHAWVRRGTGRVEARPRNWGDNLTLVGASRADHWVTMSTFGHGTTAERVLAWLWRRLGPKLRRRDVLILDNLSAHKDPRVHQALQAAGAEFRYLPPDGHDVSPIDAAWGLLRKRIRAAVPRTGLALGRTAQHGSRAVRPPHCQNFFAHHPTDRWA